MCTPPRSGSRCRTASLSEGAPVPRPAHLWAASRTRSTHPDLRVPCLRTQLHGRTRRFVSMLGIFPGELIGVGFLVLTAVLLGGFVYFFFIKKG